MNIYKERITYKPFDYPWVYQSWDDHENMHWTARDIRLDKDVQDFKEAPAGLKEYITKLMLLFTQQDVDVGNFYTKYICNAFPKPEIKMLASGIASRESIHQNCYALFVETIGLGDETFTEFLHIPELAAKHNLYEIYEDKIKHLNQPKYIKDYLNIVVYSGFGEGVSLFTSFGMLLSLSMPEINKFSGLETIVNYSIKDEQVHFTSMLKLIKEELFNNFTAYEKDFVKEFILEFVDKLYNIEKDFILYTFKDTGITHITAQDMLDYLTTIIDERLQYLFNINLYKSTESTQSTKIKDWITFKIGGEIQEQFFEVKATAYTKGGVDMTTLHKCNFTLGGTV